MLLPTLDNERPPHRWPTTAGRSYHHIIPYRLLKEVWNSVLGKTVDTQLPEARQAARQYLILCARWMPDADSRIEQIRRGTLTVPQCIDLQMTAAWPAWNVVEGPGNRSDDPQSTGFDLDRFTHGMTLIEFGRMKHIDLLYAQFLDYAAVGSLSGLVSALKTARESLSADGPIPFRESMWVKDIDGRWRKRRSGDQFIL